MSIFIELTWIVNGNNEEEEVHGKRRKMNLHNESAGTRRTEPQEMATASRSRTATDRVYYYSFICAEEKLNPQLLCTIVDQAAGALMPQDWTIRTPPL